MNAKYTPIIGFLLSQLIGVQAYSQTDNEKPVAAASKPAVAAAAASTPAAAASDSTKASPTISGFFGTGWSVGLAILKNKQAVIGEATIAGNVVRANSSQTSTTELVVSRAFFLPNTSNKDKCGPVWLGTDGDYCLGGFVSAGIGGQGSGQFIDMIGGGLLLGFGSRPTNQSQALKQHNIGIGYGRRFGIKTLGDGITRDAPLPTGETQIRYKNTDMSAVFLTYMYTLD